MNNIYQVIFNKSTQQFAVVSELAKSAGKPKAVSAGSVDIVSILQNFSEKRPEINSDSLSIKTKETTTLKGAVANINHLALETKNLHIESVQDTEKYDSKQSQVSGSGSLALGANGLNGGVSAQFSQNKANVDYAQVTQQSGFNIKESSNINVEENTHIKSGIIHAQGDKANHQMTTGTLTTEEIENRSDIKVSSVSVGVSSDNTKMATMAVGAALSALGNMSESERSHTKAAISSNINLSITDSDKQKALTGKTAEDTIASLNRDTENANQAVEKADLNSIQEKQETVQVIGELSQSWTNRLVQPHLEEANKKRQEAEQLEKSDPLKSAQLKAEAKAIEAEYGLGSNLQMGVRAATAALQGLATGNANQAAVGLLSPYANKLIKEQTGDNTEANLIAHAVLGAVEAHITGNNAAAGALGAFTAEAAAPYLMQAMYGTDKATELTESQKQNIANLSQIAAGLASGVTGDSTADFISGVEIGKRAVENNYLSHRDVYAYQQALKKAIEKGESAEEVHKYFKALSEKQRAELLADCEIDCRVTVPQTLLGAVTLADDLSGALNSWVQGLPFDEQSKFYQLVESENQKTIQAIKDKQTDLEKGIELAVDASRLLGKENSLGNSNTQNNFARKSQVQRPTSKPVYEDNIQTHEGAILSYKSNPKHTNGRNPKAGLEPENVIELFKNSVDASKMGDNKYIRYVKDDNGNIHRFFGDKNNLEFHWSGSTGDINNPLNENTIPNAIKKKLGGKE